ncbi:hypothetical protein DFA_07576 [Cavenderia fasciculata]|uniref:DUF38 domain-containing protein n=1 Tax=Cavenderia fasciculata TaxID=261658 RepID=F4PWT8_CACFS|nr:uncharacterized protein DFA_07576 [Cavenderia fasciculata]EGG20452.1 hypothetical protein DFA_07576 [Cavenderia fasciculata]|eukprot:XP_004367435.1 hypothetical protein DFA_07576 [Cavenderia fasciculata]
MTCKRLFSFISKNLIKNAHCLLQVSEIDVQLQHQHFSNQYCLLGKSIETFTIDLPNHFVENTWEFLQADHYSKIQSLKFESKWQYSKLPSPTKLFLGLVGFEYLTCLNLSNLELDTDSGIAIDDLKNIPLQKLYYNFKDNQFLFKAHRDGGDKDDPNEWPLTKSLEAVSINSFDVIPMLDRLPKLRHLRIIVGGRYHYLDVAELQSTNLPPCVTKLSFTDSTIYSRPFISHQNNFQFIGTFYTSTQDNGIVHYKWVYIRKNN